VQHCYRNSAAPPL